MTERAPAEIWEECLRVLKELVSQQIYLTYFETIEVVAYDGADIYLRVPSEHYKQYIEEKLISHLRRAINKVVGRNVKIFYQVTIKRGDSPSASTSACYPAAPQYPRRNQNVVVLPHTQSRGQHGTARNITIDPQLHPEFCYEYLILGDGNIAAYKATKNVLNEFSALRTKMPLYFFGSPGVGKTHLIQSLGLEFRKLYPNKVVQYITSNQFTQQFTEVCARKKKGDKEAITDFESYFHTIDLLILDEVQELSARYATQEFLLNIIEHLQQANGQLIVASSVPPAYLTGFRDSLLTRLRSGSLLSIQQLEKPKRVEMLRERAQRDGINNIPEEVLDYIAQYISNARELIGVYLSLVANSTFAQREFTLELAQEIITNQVGAKALEQLTLEDIKTGVAKFYKLRLEELCEVTRRANIVEPRQIAMFLAKNYTQTPLTTIGLQLGKKSHSTVLHAAKTIQDRMDSSKEFRERVEQIKRELQIND